MSKARRDYRRLVAGAALRTIALEIPAPLLARAEALVHRYGWDEDWGEDALLVVFYHGLAALELEQAPAELDTSDPAALARATEQLRSERMGLDSRHAVLRFHLFELMKSNRIMGMRETALRTDNHGLRLRLERFERDRQALERQLASLVETANQGAGALEESAPTGPAEQPSVIGRLRAWLCQQLAGSDARAGRGDAPDR